MAKNTGNDFRRGAVTARTQFQHENGDWQKRNEGDSQSMERKSSEGQFKGARRRRTAAGIWTTGARPGSPVQPRPHGR